MEILYITLAVLAGNAIGFVSAILNYLSEISESLVVRMLCPFAFTVLAYLSVAYFMEKSGIDQDIVLVAVIAAIWFAPTLYRMINERY